MLAKREVPFDFGAYVHRRLFGLGQVSVAGVVPVVRFLDGRVCHVTRCSLQNVDTDTFEAEIANRSRLEAWLTIRVHGPERLPRDGRVYRRDERGLWTTEDRRQSGIDIHAETRLLG